MWAPAVQAILDGAGGMVVSIAPEGMRERGQMHPDRLWAFIGIPACQGVNGSSAWIWICLAVIFAVGGTAIAATHMVEQEPDERAVSPFGPTTKPIEPDAEPAKQVDFGGDVWLTYAEPVRGHKSVQAVQIRMAYALAVDDFNSYLEEGGAEWRVKPGVAPYRHSVLEALVAVQAGGDHMLKHLYGNATAPYGFQVLAIAPHGRSVDARTGAYVEFHDVIVITGARHVPVQNDRIFSLCRNSTSAGDAADRISGMVQTVTGRPASARALAVYDSVWLYGLAIERSGTLQVLDLAAALPDVAAGHEGALGGISLNGCPVKCKK